MIHSYTSEKNIDQKFDAIIIGSGIGGLTTAAILAKEGKKVAVLERHFKAGGFTHMFKRKGFEWDVGIHYIGEVNREESALRKIFDYISDGKLQWADMGDVYDTIVLGDKKYEFVKGVSNFKRQLSEYFPEEKGAIEKYVDLVFEASKTSKKYYMAKALSPFMDKVIGAFLRKPFFKYSDKTTYEVLSSLTKNETLIKVLSGQYGDYGMPPKQGSFAMHASVARHYFNGGSYPVGGSSQILNSVGELINDLGGSIYTKAEVEKVLVEDNTAVGVRLSDGKELKADIVVSDAGVFNTFDKLIDDKLKSKYNLKNKLSNIKRSVAHLALYIGLDGGSEELNLAKTNYWVYPEDGDHDTCVKRYLEDHNQPFPVAYISFPSSKDPQWKEKHPDKSTIEIITLIPYEYFEKWADKPWKNRGEDYEAEKEIFAQRLLEVLYKQLPQLEGKVSYYELSTPLSTKHFSNYEKGEIYGIDHSPYRFRQNFLRATTPINNLYLTGQDIVTAGIGGALFAGVISSSAILGRNVLRKII